MNSAKILNGRLLADEILIHLKDQITQAKKSGTRAPGLCTILVGNDAASQIYVRNKIKQAEQIGVQSFHHALSSNISEVELLALIDQQNRDQSVDGILVQLPLPKHIRTQAVLEAISPLKDVDGFHPENVGLLSIGAPRFVPCTPKGCMRLIEKAGVNLLGVHAVIIGRSNIVGKPMAQLLLNSQATVTVCHKNTKNLREFTRQADLLITATGSPHLIGPEDVKSGVVILDIGITRLDTGKLAGDAQTEALMSVARAITPVPGGVGPMTLAMLLENTWMAYNLKQAKYSTLPSVP